MFKQVATITGLMLVLFFGSYFGMGLLVDKVMGDQVYGEYSVVTGKSDQLKVEPYYGEQKPNLKVQETQDPQWGMR